jgi:hypothetical protein
VSSSSTSDLPAPIWPIVARTPGRSPMAAILAGVDAAAVDAARAGSVYLAGPITSKPASFRAAFALAGGLLARQGLTVVSPVVEDQADFSPEAWQGYMRRSLQLMLGCSAVSVLPDWEDSRGATLEVEVAQALGMPVRTTEQWLRLLRTFPG